MHFLSLNQAVSYLQRQFPNDGTVEIDGKHCPPFLFRGESELYPSTVPTGQRIACDPSLDGDDRKQLVKVTRFAGDYLRRDSQFQAATFGRPASYIEPFLQHYGFPTGGTDFTSQIEVAAAFASSGRVGRLAVMPSKLASAAGLLVSLRDHDWAERARKQFAYFYASRLFDDLKSRDASSTAGIRWYSFVLTKQDQCRFTPKLPSLMETGNDAFAFLPRQAVTEFVRQQEKLRHRVAQWLVGRLPMVRSVGRLLNYADGYRDVLLRPPRGQQFVDEATLQRKTLRSWSDDFPGVFPPADYHAIVVEYNPVISHCEPLVVSLV